MSERIFITEYRPGKIPGKTIATQCGCQGRRAYKATWKNNRRQTNRGLEEKLEFPRDALAPVPPGVEPDNLLLANISHKTVTLRFKIPGTVVDPDADAVVLLVDGSAVGDPITFKGYRAGQIFTIALPAIARKEGTHSIQYRLHYSSNGTEDGPLQSFIVDLTAPGQSSLPELIVEGDVQDGGVTSATLETHNGKQYLRTALHYYRGLAIGDKVQGVIAGLNGPGSTLDIEQRHDDGEEIVLRFPREDIERARDGLRAFTYTITDRAGNVSIPSLPLNLKVLLEGELIGLPAPEVAADDDGIINEQEARQPLEVIIPAYSINQRKKRSKGVSKRFLNKGILPGDEIELIWGSAHHELLPIAEGEEGERLPVYPNYAALYDTWRAQSQGRNEVARIAVLYRIIRDGLVAGTSAVRTVTINLHQAGGDPEPEVPIHPNLRPVVLMSSSGWLNQIPKDDYDKDAKLFLPWFDRHSPPAPVLVEDDEILLMYGTHVFAPRIVSAIDVGNKVDLEFILTADVIASQGSGTQETSYTVRRPVEGGTHNTSYGPMQPVLVDGDEQLPGDGNLGAGEYAPLVNPDHIILEDINNGVCFVTPAYKYKRPGDLIEIDLVQATGDGHSGGETTYEQSRITLSHRVVDASEETETYPFLLPADKLLAPNARCHIHSLWKVTRNGKPVENNTTPQLIVDTRRTTETHGLNKHSSRGGKARRTPAKKRR